MLKQLNVTYGADPENFFSKDGIIVGSEKVLPTSGLKSGTAIHPHVVLDGVQFELNPPTRSSVPLLGREISTAFTLIARHLAKMDSHIKLDWRCVVEVGRAELDSMSEATRQLGCLPSSNAHEDRPFKADPKTYLLRSAGGHLHFGVNAFPNLKEDLVNLVGLFDVFVGNTLALIDRDPGATIRRENYGRAGEYRTPKYGIEYRTPSNFWLKNYSLMSLTFGLAQIALSVANSPALVDDLLDVVEIKHVVEAINTNNFDLALNNFENLRPFLVKHLPQGGFQLSVDNLDKFLVFAKGVHANGLTQFFPEDPLAHWVKGEQVEFSEFLKTVY